MIPFCVISTASTRFGLATSFVTAIPAGRLVLASGRRTLKRDLLNILLVPTIVHSCFIQSAKRDSHKADNQRYWRGRGLSRSFKLKLQKLKKTPHSSPFHCRDDINVGLFARIDVVNCRLQRTLAQNFRLHLKSVLTRMIANNTWVSSYISHKGRIRNY